MNTFWKNLFLIERECKWMHMLILFPVTNLFLFSFCYLLNNYVHLHMLLNKGTLNKWMSGCKFDFNQTRKNINPFWSGLCFCNQPDWNPTKYPNSETNVFHTKKKVCFDQYTICYPQSNPSLSNIITMYCIVHCNRV